MSRFSSLDGTFKPQLNLAAPCENEVAATLKKRGGLGQFTSSCLLYLMPPRQTVDFINRPLAYSFGGAVMERATDAIQEMLKGSDGDNLAPVMFNNALNNTVMPSANGEYVGTSHLGYYWTFIFITDQPYQKQFPIAAVKPVRYIYSGIIMDEPLVTQNGRTVYNDGAVFTVTHTVQSTIDEKILPGGIHQTFQPVADMAYIPTGLLGAVTNSAAPVYNLDPGVIASDMRVDSASDSAIQGEVPIVGFNQSSIAASTTWNSAFEHRRDILAGITDAITCQTTYSTQGYNQSGNYGFESEPLINTFASLVKNKQPCIGPIRHPEKPFTLQELMGWFNNAVQIVKVATHTHFGADTRMGAEPTRENIYSSLIASSIPPIMSTLGLVDVAFTYCNSLPRSNQNIIMSNRVQDAFHWVRASTVMPCSNEQLKMILKNFENYIRIQVLSIIDTGPNPLYPMFEYTFSYFSASEGNSLVNFYIHGEGAPENVYIARNNMFGGLNSPIFGNINALRSNGNQLYNLLDISASQENVKMDGPMMNQTLFPGGFNSQMPIY